MLLTHNTNPILSKTPCKQKKAPSRSYQNLTVQESNTRESVTQVCYIHEISLTKWTCTRGKIYAFCFCILQIHEQNLETRYDLSTTRYPCYIFHNVHSSPSTLTSHVCGLFLYNVCNNILSYIQWGYYVFIMYTYSHKHGGLLSSCGARTTMARVILLHDPYTYNSIHTVLLVTISPLSQYVGVGSQSIGIRNPLSHDRKVYFLASSAN